MTMNNPSVRLRPTGALDRIAPVYLDLLDRDGLPKKSCMLSLTEAESLLRTGKLPTIKPYMDRQALIDIAQVITEERAS